MKWDARPVARADDGGLSARPHEHALDRSERSDAHHPDRQPAHQRLRARRQRQPDAGVERSPAATRIRTPSSPARPSAPRPAPRSARCRTTRCRSGTTIGCTRRCRPASALLYRSDMFVAIDNTVTLPGYTRADAALFYSRHAERRACSSTSRTCSTRTTSSTPTATRTSRRAPRGRSGLRSSPGSSAGRRSLVIGSASTRGARSLSSAGR